MSATGVNVLRWGALVFGVFYGFSHQNAIKSSDIRAAAQREWDQKVKRIEDAKLAYAEKTSPSKGDGVISDPNDPKFDLEKYLLKVSKDNP